MIGSVMCVLSPWISQEEGRAATVGRRRESRTEMEQGVGGWGREAGSLGAEQSQERNTHDSREVT